MSDVLEDTYEALQEAGEQVTLTRPGTTPVSVTCWAKVTVFQPQEIGGGVMQGDRHVILSNFEIAANAWPGPPRRGDVVIIAGKQTTVQSVETLALSGVTIRHNMQVRGSG